MVREKRGGRASYIRNSYLRWGLRGGGKKGRWRSRGFSSVINTDSFLPTAILNHKKEGRDFGYESCVLFDK